MFSRINLCLGYCQIRIAKRDEEKTTYYTKYGFYKFLVMIFGFINAPAKFCTFMNDIFQKWLDDFVVIYIDNILVYNNFMEEHVKHLREVFQRLRKNELYVKFKKCEFGVMKVDFLGHKIIQESLKMDDHKVKAILDWEPPRLVLALKPFLRIGLLLSQVHQELCKNNHAFDQPFEKIMHNL